MKPTPKLTAVMNYIAEREYVADVWYIVEELGVSPSTVRRAVNTLTQLGAVKDGQWVGRDYIPFDEIAPFIDTEIGTFLSDAFYERIIRSTFAKNRLAVWLPISRALNFRQIVAQARGSYGDMFVRRIQ